MRHVAQPWTGTASISELGFGAAGIGNLYRALADEEATLALDAAVAAGITWFDTAPFYGYGLSELRLGRFLRGRPRSSYVLSTKVGCVMTAARTAAPAGPFVDPLPFTPLFDYSYGGTLRAFEQSQMRLGLPRPDIVFVHDLDRRNHGSGFERQRRIAVKGAFEVLQELRRNGDIGAMGLAVNEAELGAELLQEADFDVALLAGRYTLLDHSALDSFLPAAQSRGVAIVLGGVFNSGILATGAVSEARFDYAPASAEVLRRTQDLAAACARHDVPLTALALQFARAHPAVRSILIGVSRAESVARNVAALEWPIPNALWRELTDLELIPAHAPLPGGPRRTA